MPVLSRFYGIIIRMYFQQAEHNPPHIHALYGEDMAAIDIQTGEVLEGHLPPKGACYGTGVGGDPQKRSSAYVGDTGVQAPFSP